MATFLGTKIHIHQLKWQPSELLACNYRNRGFFFNPHFLAQSWPPHKLMDGRWLSKYQTRWNCMLPLWNGSLAPRAHWKRVHLDHNSIEAHFNKVFFPLTLRRLPGHNHYRKAIPPRLVLLFIFCGFLRWELVTEMIMQRTGFIEMFHGEIPPNGLYLPSRRSRDHIREIAQRCENICTNGGKDMAVLRVRQRRLRPICIIS